MLSAPISQRCIGSVCFVLAVIVMLPIPLGNMLPALAICLLALGLIEEDGIWILAGLTTTIGSVILISGVLYAAFRAIALLTSGALVDA